MAFGNVALHLGAQDQLGLEFGDLCLYRQVVVADQCLYPVELGRVAHLAGKFAAVGAQAHHLKAHFLAGHAGCGDGM